MSPEDLLCHGTPKGEIYVVLYGIVKASKLGLLFTDSTRVSSTVGEVSAEPDIVFVSWKAIESKKVPAGTQARPTGPVR